MSLLKERLGRTDIEGSTLPEITASLGLLYPAISNLSTPTMQKGVEQQLVHWTDLPQSLTTWESIVFVDSNFFVNKEIFERKEMI